jgi:hypothetical protein
MLVTGPIAKIFVCLFCSPGNIFLLWREPQKVINLTFSGINSKKWNQRKLQGCYKNVAYHHLITMAFILK